MPKVKAEAKLEAVSALVLTSTFWHYHEICRRTKHIYYETYTIIAPLIFLCNGGTGAGPKSA